MGSLAKHLRGLGPIFAVLAILTAILILPSGMPVTAQRVTIDPRVIEDTANGKVGPFLVLLRAQANTRGTATASQDRDLRARAVFEALTRTASSSQAPLRVLLDSQRASYRSFWIVNAFAVVGSRALVEALAARSDVQAIESDRAFRVPLEQPETFAPAATSAVEWNISGVNAPALWALGYTGQGRVYANADTGVNWTHPALLPHYRGWNGLSADHNFNWHDAIHSDLNGNNTNPCGYNLAAPCDDYSNYHGTHTMGTGIGDDGAGNQIGMAPGAKWIACRNMEEGTGRPSTYIECFQFFLAPTDLNGNNPDVTKRPDAVGNSYDCPPLEGCSSNSLLAAMDNLRIAGIFMSVSAGNSGSACSTISNPPGLYASAITVGATDFMTDTIASFSSRGPVTADGSNRRKPDLTAPGANVRSSSGTSSYAILSGTSMAAPHVAGAAVLLWSAFPELRHNVDYTENLLEQTARHQTAAVVCGNDTNQVPNNTYGYGRIDLLAAYNHFRSFGRFYVLPLIFNQGLTP